MEYKLIYTNRRTVGLTVKDGELIVRSPHGLKKEKIDEICLKHEAWIEKNIKRSLETSEKPLADDEKDRLIKNATEYFPLAVSHYADIMKLFPKGVKVTSAKRRFGSCSKEGRICFSYRLMLYPESAREYVVVHELAHLKEMNHGKRFYKIIEQVMPDYKERRKLLKSK